MAPSNEMQKTELVPRDNPFVLLNVFNDLKPTVVIGASEKPERFSNKAVRLLKAHLHPVYPIGPREGYIDGIAILTGQPPLENIHTVSLYLAPQNQTGYYDYILGLSPRRVIFNPGTENSGFANQCTESGIEVCEACTLVMLNNGSY